VGRSAAVGLAAASYGRVAGAGDRIRVANIGCGRRGLLRELIQLKDTANLEIAAVCDTWRQKREKAAFDVKERTGVEPKQAVYFAGVLADQSIDAVVIGTPDHQHCTMLIDAIRAGKDVYVEKPVSHTIEEGERLGKAAAEARRVIQIGYQQRSWEHFQLAREIIASGKLGKITMVLASWYQNYPRWMANQPRVDREKLDWKRFLGSAPAQPFDELRFLRWRWFWDFGGGHLTDLYSHWIDVIHWLMGVDSPSSVEAMGQSFELKQFECPDTMSASYMYPGGWMAVYTGTIIAHLEGGNLVFRGTRAMMKLNRDGFAVYPEGVVPAEITRLPDPEISVRSMGDGTAAHLKNFADCVRSRKQPNAPVEAGISAARAAHLGNLALRKARA
jgi:predicted dehydrogenase